MDMSSARSKFQRTVLNIALGLTSCLAVTNCYLNGERLEKHTNMLTAASRLLVLGTQNDFDMAVRQGYIRKEAAIRLAQLNPVVGKGYIIGVTSPMLGNNGLVRVTLNNDRSKEIRLIFVGDTCTGVEAQ